MNTKFLLTALASTAVVLSLAQAQNTGQPRLGRTAPASAILERQVVSQGGKNLGEVKDVVFDMESGRILYLAMDLKGAGLNDNIAVPPALFTYGMGRGRAQSDEGDGGLRAQGRQPLVLRASEEALKGAPKYADTGEERAEAAYVDKVYAHFNQPRWWEGAAGSKAGSFNHLRRASQIEKLSVQNSAGEKLGKVETVLFNLPAGRVTFVMVDPAGRISNKQQLLPVPPMALTRTDDHQVVALGVDDEKLKNAPTINRDELKAEDIRQLSNPQFATKVYNYYGKQPWFGSETIPSPTGPENND